MRTFENQVQKIKNEVYKKVSQYAFEGNLTEKITQIPKELNAGPNPRLRCCVYHERVVTSERVQMSLGGNPEVGNLIEVLESACDQCTEHRYVITESCRGCLAHRCQQSCPVDAIKIINKKAVIDYDRCIECGRCHTACPYDAVSDVLRPCIKSCPTKAIAMDEHKKATIDENLCILCGACVYHCPFGAIQDKSQITQVIEALVSKDKKVYGVIAPAIATQFDYMDLEQVVAAMKYIGFNDVIEVALGADMVVVNEAEEFVERMASGASFMASSCCPAFVRYIHQEFESLVPYISDTVSPMVATTRLVRSIDPDGIVVFVGPCIAKKDEVHYQELKDEVDFVLTFEELTGIIESKNIDVDQLERLPLNNASPFGRGFAASGGLTKALEKVLADDIGDHDYKTMVCDGIDDCKKALTLAKLGRLKNTFIEGMACKGGCIRGPATMHYGPADSKKLTTYCNEAIETNSRDALRVFESGVISLHK